MSLRLQDRTHQNSCPESLQPQDRFEAFEGTGVVSAFVPIDLFTDLSHTKLSGH